MRFVAILLAALGATTFFSRAVAAEEVVVTIYLVKELDVCPGGYSQGPRCPRFTAAKFEELRSKKKLQRLGSPKTFSVERDQGNPLIVPLGKDLGLVRRYRDSGSKTVALIMVEWRKPEAPGSSLASPYQQELSDDDIITSAIENRRAFSHGNVRNLDPGERHVWISSRGGKSFSVIFE